LNFSKPGFRPPSDTENNTKSVSLSAEDYKRDPWLELAFKYINRNQSSDFTEIKESIALGWAKESASDKR